ncbi:MAG: response regulator [Myxococcales bacterium]|nr:response regulator [Myxococcales bacterium]
MPNTRARRRLRVLLIDDDAAIREIARLALVRLADHELDEASSGAEGISLAKLSPPDLILLDRTMPGLDGLETLLLIRKDRALREIPVVFLTGRTSASELARYQELGAIGAIAKPFDPHRLARQVEGILEARAL